MIILVFDILELRTTLTIELFKLFLLLFKILLVLAHLSFMLLHLLVISSLLFINIFLHYFKVIVDNLVHLLRFREISILHRPSLESVSFPLLLSLFLLPLSHHFSMIFLSSQQILVIFPLLSLSISLWLHVLISLPVLLLSILSEILGLLSFEVLLSIYLFVHDHVTSLGIVLETLQCYFTMFGLIFQYLV